jgi:hypothetical protein
MFRVTRRVGKNNWRDEYEVAKHEYCSRYDANGLQG